MNCWVRTDMSRSKHVGVFLHTTSNWTGRCHAHDDRVQWVMPIKPGYRLLGCHSLDEIPAHSVTIIPPETEHSHVTTEEPNVLLISLNRRVWDELLASWQDDGGRIPPLSGVLTSLCSETGNLLARIHQTAQQELIPGASLVLEALSIQFVVSWLQSTSHQGPRFHHEQAIQTLCKKLRQSLSHPWTVECMAHEVALSPSQLLRCFKAVTNSTPHKYLQRLRLDYTVEQLSRTAKPIEIIARESGFQSTRGLEMAVRQRYGVSPSELRGIRS